MAPPAPLAPYILVAEDNVEQRSLYVSILIGAGYRVLEAGDGAEAVDVVRRERPGLVLMDVTMPGTSGWNAVLSDIQPDRHCGGTPASDHASGPANYLFADSHVVAVKGATLKKRIEAGDNFAQPPQ